VAAKSRAQLARAGLKPVYICREHLGIAALADHFLRDSFESYCAAADASIGDGVKAVRAVEALTPSTIDAIARRRRRRSDVRPHRREHA
jgi:hypothetical protein